MHVRRVTGIAPASRFHVIAEVIETELAIGAVSNVAFVGPATLRSIHVRLNVTGGDTHALIDGRHPFAIPAGQVIVDRNDMDPLAGQRVEHRRQCGNQRLAFARGHFRDLALVQHNAAEDLHIEVSHILVSPRGLTNRREHFD
ncbi:hypothetical protein HRbin36_02464 [bacterium HR36]|nr:hypothetical protein HRbin36_02464 [bacterium HR36]